MFNGNGFAIEIGGDLPSRFGQTRAAHRVIPAEQQQEQAGSQGAGSINYDGSIVISLCGA
ncbi:hypothetical protein FJP62_18025 [Pantoea vagans]|uniref:hypothetical protein n=1 Tax=Pantoea anthophila TaxID=470931 RepID=UPI0011227959|nr:hypothetical protein FJP62_18025 [Pantoea vagans]